VLGNIADTVPTFLATLPSDAPVGFVSLDVDYYWSSVDALTALTGPPQLYLPLVTMYLDDITRQTHNRWCGELAAIEDFNTAQRLRKIAPFTFLREGRLFKNANWIGQIYTRYVLDHPSRFTLLADYGELVLDNPYLSLGEVGELASTRPHRRRRAGDEGKGSQVVNCEIVGLRGTLGGPGIR
jgi:hypothetical protein